MYQLATIQVNLRGLADDTGIFVADILDWQQDESGGCVVRFRDGRPPIKVTETTTQIQTAINALWDEYAARGSVSNRLEITDGVTAPGAGSGVARIYVDTADGDLKCVFSDGTVKVIVADT